MGGRGAIITWKITDAWTAAATVTAAAYGVPAALITAPSRGRGPRPATAVQLPKKMAVYLAVVLAGCDYAALGRAIGLHRDTVASHCAWMRHASAEDHELGVLIAALEISARSWLTLHREPTGAAPPPIAEARGDPRARLDGLQRFMANTFDAARRRLSDEQSGSSDTSDTIAHHHENVIP